jgi:hypothetical protein
MKTIYILTTLFIFSILSLHAESIEELAEKEPIDNEAVVAYGGKVGKLPAIFAIEWAGKKVFGYYYHPSKGRKKMYQLEGSNPKQGVVILKEYTSLANGERKHTATIHLKKSIIDGRIIWSGVMNNTDGRKLPVSFSRNSK